jgi:hypothetical protein
MAEQWIVAHNPANEEARNQAEGLAFKLVFKPDDVKRDIRELEATSPRSITEIAMQADRLNEVHERVMRIEAKLSTRERAADDAEKSQDLRAATQSHRITTRSNILNAPIEAAKRSALDHIVIHNSLAFAA